MQIGASDRIDMLCAAFLNKIVMFLCYADFVYDFTALKHAVMDCSAQAISPVSYTHLDVYKRQGLESFYFSSMSYPTWKVALAIDH